MIAWALAAERTRAATITDHWMLFKLAHERQHHLQPDLRQHWVDTSGDTRTPGPRWLPPRGVVRAEVSSAAA